MTVIRIDQDVANSEADIHELNKGAGDPNKTETTNTSIQKDENKKPIEIVVDGPLGHTYTAILAAMYAKESMTFETAIDTTENPTSPIEKENIKEQALKGGGLVVADRQEGEQADTYIYTVNADHLESKSSGKINEELHIALDKNNAKVKYVAIEETKHNPKVNACLEMYMAKGVKVIRNKNGLKKVLP